jgi:agmatine deiminase
MTDLHTPVTLGYRVAAEWEPHAATWLSWPRREKTWPGKFDHIPAVWAELVRTLAEFEPVHILAGGREVLAQAQTFVGHLANVTLHDIPTNDAWLRDNGPTFLVSPPGAPPALIDWEFNAWGGKYPSAEDNRVPGRIAELLARVRFRPGIVLEGGSLDPNGLGTLLTTEQCLLNVNRNPSLKREDLERCLAQYWGARRVLWLGGGIVGDDTDGHVDQLARFVGPRTVVAALEQDPQDANYDSLQANYQRLLAMTDQDGQPLTVIPLPMPRPVIYNGNRLPASYANFYIANGLVIVPQFDDPADAQAVAMLAELFPDRAIRGLRAVDLVLGSGAFHCVTQQEPACL